MKPYKSSRILLLAALTLTTALVSTQAQLIIPSDGSDRALNPSENIEIDLSKASEGEWNMDNTANQGNGVYDANKWAVTFKYSSVNIPAGVKVTFKNHRTRCPVVWLVQGEVRIDGELNLAGKDGGDGLEGLISREPGPGGFRGGASGPQGNGVGLGPGGGASGDGKGIYDPIYGNPQLIPLIGGSGGNAANGNIAGGPGGGAILIAAAGIVTLEGRITTGGGRSSASVGSGGAVRVIASQVKGGGEIYCFRLGYEYPGRIRIETGSLSPTIRTSPETIAVPPSVPPMIWPPDAAPKVRIVSVNSIATPVDPSAPLVSHADVAIQNDSSVTVTLETRDFPIEGSVQLRVAQKWGVGAWLNASYVSGNQASATWQAQTTFVKGYSTLQARATAP